MSSITRLKVCYNNGIRRLFNLPYRASISRTCVENGIPTFQEVRRKGIVSLYQRLRRSSNSIVSAFMKNAFQRSYLYDVWRPLAFVWFNSFLAIVLFTLSRFFCVLCSEAVGRCIIFLSIILILHIFYYIMS